MPLYFLLFVFWISSQALLSRAVFFRALRAARVPGKCIGVLALALSAQVILFQQSAILLQRHLFAFLFLHALRSFPWQTAHRVSPGYAGAFPHAVQSPAALSFSRRALLRAALRLRTSGSLSCTLWYSLSSSVQLRQYVFPLRVRSSCALQRGQMWCSFSSW